MSRRDQGRTTIFLIEEDDDTRPLLRENLQRDGYRVIIAIDEADALERVENSGPHADLLLLNVVKKTTYEALDIGRRILQHGGFPVSTHLVVMAEKYDQTLEGTDVNVLDNQWITYLEDGEQLRRLLARLLPTAANPDTGNP